MSEKLTIADIGELHHIPIPDIPSVEGWQAVPITDNQEPLVPMGVFSDTGIYTDSIYASEHTNSPYDPEIKDSYLTVYARQGLVDALERIQQRLPKGLHLVVFDAYRSTDTQGALFDTYYRSLAAARPELTRDELLAETQKYVSLPSDDPSRPAPHLTGGAVDLALFWLPPTAQERLDKIDDAIAKASPEQQCDLRIGRHNLIASRGLLMEFGTPFDYGGPEAALTYYEQKTESTLALSEQTARNHRRLLFHLMAMSGLQPYEHEWWHFNSPLTQMGAVAVGNTEAHYGSAELTPELDKLELQRRQAQPLMNRKTLFPLAAIITPPETTI